MQSYLKNELIDTQWDVNIIVEPLDNSLDGGINRYIVGCKYARKGANNKVACELIDTQWDVNFSDNELKIYNFDRINRYIVGCKSYRP